MPISSSGRSGKHGNGGEATVTYDKVVHVTDRNLPDVFLDDEDALVDHWGIVKADIGIKGGRISAIGKAAASAATSSWP